MKSEKAIAILQDICSRHEKCCSDIKKKLDLWEIPDIKHEAIINKLIKEKFVDEKRYTGFFVNDKFRFNKWGKIKIRFALSEKGIKDEHITSALEKIDPTEYYNTIKELLIKKLAGINDTDMYKKKARLMRFGQSRGFESDLLFSLADQLLQKE